MLLISWVRVGQKTDIKQHSNLDLCLRSPIPPQLQTFSLTLHSSSPSPQSRVRWSSSTAAVNKRVLPTLLKNAARYSVPVSWSSVIDPRLESCDPVAAVGKPRRPCNLCAPEISIPIVIL